jgi:membrane associated rhomboid family serine protease
MFPIRDTIPSRSFPFMTIFLILLNVGVFALELQLPPQVLEAFTYYFGLVPARYSHPAWASVVGFPLDNYWPFFTTMFLHGGWLHIIANMWSLWLFGDNVEDAMGSVRFFFFYVICGLVAAFTHYVTNLNSTMPVVGASGAIAGVMGAYFVLYPRAKIVTLIPIIIIPFFVQIPAFLYLALWIISQLLSGTASLASAGDTATIAFWAHIGGFGAGIVLHPFFARHPRSRRRAR